MESYNKKNGVVVIGAGGHAKVCIEVLISMGYIVAFCINDSDSPNECLKIPVLHGDENLVRLRSEGFSKVFIAIGSNEVRSKLFLFCSKLGYEVVSAISPYSIISKTATLGTGIAVMVGSVINSESIIGDLSIINTGATIDHDCVIGDAVHVAPQCVLAGNVKVGRNSFLGVGCNVIPNINIGENVIIGAGGVVIHDVKSSSKLVGVPAKNISLC